MTDPRASDDCFRTDRDRLTHAQALSILRAHCRPIVARETVPLERAGGRILSQAIESAAMVPGADNAAVDGYAFRHADYTATGGFFPVAMRISAGHPATTPLATGAAARIFTGAWMPEGADSVAMQEDCETHEQDGADFVVIPPDLKAGANRRKAGEDLMPGDEIACAGDRLRPQELAAAASVGLTDIPVFARLRVALFSTGDEVAAPGADLVPGSIHDANKPLLSGLLAADCHTTTDCGRLPDKADAVEAAFLAAADTHDAIITTGGVSRGAEDHIVNAIENLGTRHFWQIAIKPGRPMAFGQIGRSGSNREGNPVFLGLPGNPVAAFVCFLLYARPSLLALAGASWREPETYAVAADFSLPNKKPDRREFLRGRLAKDAQGRPVVKRFARDGSGLVTSLRQADGLIVVPENVTEIRRGEPVTFMPFSQFGI